jgi:hypothetical protein
MKRRFLVLALGAMLLVTLLAVSALPALGQPRAYCDWYEAGFDRDFNTAWYGYWCHYHDYGWYLVAWWSEDTGYIPLY